MFKLDPPISVKKLSAVTPGSFIHWGEDRTGICVVSAGAPHQRSVIVYEPETGTFEYVGGEWPTVIAYETGVEIRPDLHTFVDNASIGHARAIGTLYIDDAGKPFLAPTLVTLYGS